MNQSYKQDIKMEKIHEVETITTQISNEADGLFLCSSSFEDRCRRVPLLLPKSNYSSYYSVMFNYYQGEKQNRRFFNREKIYDSLSSITIKKPVEPIDCDRLNPLEGVEKFIIFLEKNGIGMMEGAKITIDISTFTKQYILQLLRDIENYFEEQCSIRILYTEPGIYGRGGFKRLSYGIEDIVIVPRFEGKHMPDCKTALVVFLGYESHRTLAAIEELEPDLVIAVIGDPPYYPKWDEYSLKTHSYLLSMPDIKIYKMPAREPDAVREGLIRIWNEFSKDYPNIYISPIGTKLQTIGIYEFARFHPAVRVIYPIPQGYLENYYTIGYGKTWEYFLPPKETPER
jgi:hypothetical protein